MRLGAFPNKPRINTIRRRTEVQAPHAWKPPTGTLGGIVSEARERARTLLARRAELAERAAATRDGASAPSFADALGGRPTVAVIAEVKRRSPSKGWINPGLGAADQARAYERGGAAAISVLTEPSHFGGSVDDLTQVARSVGVPVV